MAERMSDSLESDDPDRLSDLAHTLGRRRSHRAHRLSVVASSAEEMRRELQSYLEGSPFTNVRSGVASRDASKKLVMVFPGQGGQWLGMGQGLLDRESVFAASIDRIDFAYQPYIDWSLREMLEGSSGADWTKRLDVLQPTLVAVEIALAELWASWGIRPDRVIGQSMGEIAAAYVAGCLGLDDMARLACRRGQVVAEASGEGAMAVVSVSPEILNEALQTSGGGVEVAGSNSPKTTILSGDREAVSKIVAEFESAGRFARLLDVDFASHCFHMDPLLETFREQISDLESQPGRIPFDSTVDGRELSGDELDSEYWVRNLRASVSFDKGMKSAIEAGGDAFIEVSPHPVLSRAVEEIAEDLGASVFYASSIQRDQDEQVAMLTSLGELFVRGVGVDFAALSPKGKVARLPLYAYQRKKFWFSERNRSHRFRPVHPLLGECSQSSVDPRLHSWDFLLDGDSAGFLQDYRAQGESGSPGALYPEIALAVAAAMWPGKPIRVEALEFIDPLRFGESERRCVQASLTNRADRGGELRISSRPRDCAVWQLHATCRIHLEDLRSEPNGSHSLVRSTLESLPTDGHYSTLEACGFSLGAKCRTLRELERESVAESQPQSYLARLMLPRVSEAEWHAYHVHPSLLEDCFQVAGLLFESPSAVRPISIGNVEFSSSLGSECWCRITRRDPGAGDGLISQQAMADLEFFDREGMRVGRIDALHVEALPREAGSDAQELASLNRLDWVEAEFSALRTATAAEKKDVDRWIVVSDSAEEAGIFATELEKQGGSCVFCEKTEDLPSLVAQMSLDTTRSWGFLLLAWANSPLTATKEPISHREFRVGSWAAAIRDECGEAEQVWIATRGLQRLVPTEGGVGGVARLIAQEIERFASCVDMQRCRLFDASDGLAYSERVSLATLVGSKSSERQWVARDERLFVPRLVPVESSMSPARAERRFAGERNFRAVHTGREGLAAVVLEEAPEPKASPGVVVVEVASASLSQFDVLRALGQSRDRSEAAALLGTDFAGRVVSVHDTESVHRVGDEVIGICRGSLARRVSVPVSALASKPVSMDFDEAASLPFPYVVARYALEVVGRLRAGERILIMSAAGGIGQAMIGIAQSMGAEVSATAGRPERRATLHGLGVQVLEDFPESVSSEAAGFDVIVSSESGDALHAAIARLAPGGRYLDLCPRASFVRPELGALRLGANRSVSSIDIEAMMQAEPTLVSALLDRIAKDASQGSLNGIESNAFPVSQAARAIRFMAQNRHQGRVQIDFAQASETAVEGRETLGGGPEETAPFVVSCCADVGGGAEEIRSSIAAWLRDRGARLVIESTSKDLGQVLSSVSNVEGAKLAGWIHVGAEEDRGAEEIGYLAPALGDIDCGFRMVVSIRSPLCGESSRDRAWETRAWVDRLLLSDASRDGRVATMSVGVEADSGAVDANRIACLVGRSILGIEADTSLVHLTQGDLKSLFAQEPSPLLSLLEPPAEATGGAARSRAEWLSLTAPERRLAMRQFVCDALSGVLGLSEEQRDAIDMEFRVDELGLDSLMTLELFMGLGRDLDLEIGADWFGSSPTLGHISAVLLDRFESITDGGGVQ